MFENQAEATEFSQEETVYEYDNAVDPILAQKLYRMMIMAHLEDLFKAPTKRDFKEARAWIAGEGEYAIDFETACEFANWLPEQMRYVADLILIGKLTKKEYERITKE